MNDVDEDVRTATAALRDLLAEQAGSHTVADSLLPLFEARWDYGVQWDPQQPDMVHECDDQDHAREWKRDLHWDGPIVRRLAVRRVGAWQPISEQAS